MKKIPALLLTAILVCTFAVGCRSKANDNSTPSQTTAVTTMPTTAAIPETTVSTDPTIDSGNGPIDAPIDETGSTANTQQTGTASDSDEDASTRSAGTGKSAPGNMGSMNGTMKAR